MITGGDVEENGRKQRVALRRSGPYGIDNAEVRLMSEAGAATQEERARASDSLHENVDAIIHEGFRDRLRTAGRRWMGACEAEEEAERWPATRSGRAGSDRPSSRSLYNWILCLGVFLSTQWRLII